MSTSSERRITVPPPVRLSDPATGAPLLLEGLPVAWDLRAVICALMSNPRWLSSFASLKAQGTVMAAVDAARATEAPSFVLPGDVWELLRAAVEQPLTLSGGQIVPGFGVHPQVCWQLVPILSAILDATEV